MGGMKCEKFFDEVKAALENEPEQYHVRCLNTDLNWMNRTARKFWGYEVTRWSNAVRWISRRHVHKLEDAMSEAFKKPGSVQIVEIAAKIQPHRSIPLVQKITCARCESCPTQCAAIISIVEPLEQP